MCTVINFNEYRFKATKKNRLGGSDATKTTGVTDRNLPVSKNSDICRLVSSEWYKEYMSHRWGLMKLIYHVIEQYGYIRCRGEKYVFQDIKRDVRYYQMYPLIENKRLKAPLWVKVNGEWYFIEVITDAASRDAYKEKFSETGNYGVKGFVVDLDGIKTQALKRMLDENDIAGAARKIGNEYENTKFIRLEDTSKCTTSACFGCEKTTRECTYKLVEFELYEYAILEGTELETGKKHLVLLHGNDKSKEYAQYFKKQYKNAGVPLLYGRWNLRKENWVHCISHQSNLDKRLKID